MPITYEVDEANKIIRSRMHGHVTTDEFLATANEAIKDQRISSGYSHLIDMDMIQTIDIPSDIVSSTARETTDKGFLQHGKTAIVAGRDYIFALGRMYQAYASVTGRTIEVFRRREEAEEWLGLESGSPS